MRDWSGNGAFMWLGLAGLCACLAAFLGFPEAIEAPGSDTGMFATYGAMILNGARPYVDFWDLHPPLVYAYWTAVQAVTGTDWLRECVTIDTISPQSCTGLVAHGLDLVLSVAAALIVAGIARRAGGSVAVAVLAALFVVGFADQVMLSQEGSNPSKLTLVPSALAVWAYLSSLHADARRGWRGALLAGAAGAVAGFAKQPALLTLGALLLHALWRRDRTRIVGLLAGAVATVGAVLAVLAAMGSLDGFISEAWVYNVQRALVGYFVHPPKVPVIGASRVVLESAGVLVLLAVVGGVLFMRKSIGSGQRLLLVWAAVNLVAVTAFREFVYVVPGCALLAAFGLEYVWRTLRAMDTRRATIGLSLLVVACALGLLAGMSFQRTQFTRARVERMSGANLAQSEALGRIIRRDSPPGPMFVYGNSAHMYSLAGRVPATPYLNAEPLRSTAPGVERTRADLMARLERMPPPVIVLAPHSDEAELNLAEYSDLQRLLQRCYRPQAIDPQIAANWTVLVQTPPCGGSS